MTIYVELLNEGTDCWRPVEAQELEDGCFRIIGPEPDEEGWRFKPGEVVLCERKQFQTGSGLAHFEKSVRDFNLRCSE